MVNALNAIICNVYSLLNTELGKEEIIKKGEK